MTRRRHIAQATATCVPCGDVRIPVATMTVTVEQATYAHAYVFTCPMCGNATMREADLRTVLALVHAGAVEVVLAAELSEPHHGSPIAWDDVYDFHFALVGDGWRKELEATA